jgi:hypothetical protein
MPYQLGVSLPVTLTGVPRDGWSVIPLCRGGGLHRVLGFNDEDVYGCTDKTLFAMSNVFGGPSSSAESRILHLSTTQPHGCSTADTIEFIDVPAAFVSGRVVDVVSSHHLRVAVAVGVSLPPVLRLKIDRDTVVTLDVVASDTPFIGHGEIVTTCAVATPIPPKLTEDTKILSIDPSPSPEWTTGDLTAITGTGHQTVVLRLRPPAPHILQGISRIRRVPSSISAPHTIQALHRIVYVRLWLGSHECTSILRPSGPEVFARARVPPASGGAAETVYLSSADASVVGGCSIHPRLEKVSVVTVQLIDQDNHPVSGEWSMLLRIQGR